MPDYGESVLKSTIEHRPVPAAVTPLETFRFIRDEIEHEYNVLGNRLTSYITSQSFLFTTYGVSMQNPNQQWGITFRLVFPLIVCSVGVLTSARAHPGILSACMILDALHERQYELYNNPDVRQLDTMDPEWMRKVHTRSLKFSVAAAYIFGIAWIALLVLAFWVYANSVHRSS
jgi:hypothetical protein